ncbi:MAG: bifunctional phosphoglucose/phosphomannose isomerase [Candidatus Glassbacteria bacterium]
MKDLLGKLQKVDSEGMHAKMSAFPAQVEEASQLGRAFRYGAFEQIDNVVVCGMGGSAIGGDLAKDYLIDSIRVPIEVNRDYHLPAYAGKRSLVLVSSYSGNTEETISSLRDALRRGSVIRGLTTGGEIERICVSKGIPLLKIPLGFAPREALAFSFIPILFLLRPFCEGEDLEGEVAEAIITLNELSSKLSNPGQENEAYLLARDLYGYFPVIYSQSRHFSSVVRRWRSQLAENSEVLASSHQLPELSHNEIMGWEHDGDLLSRFHVVLLKDQGFNKRVLMSWKYILEIIKDKAGKVSEIGSEGKGLLARMLSLIYKGDFVTLYLSYLRGVNPTPVDKIELLKRRLAGSF